MVVYDQLRISDDGQAMFIDAHVNQSEYFRDVYLKRITICTEEQVSETNPMSVGEDYVYRKDIESVQLIQPVYDNIQILSENQLLDNLNTAGGIMIGYTPISGAETNYLSLVFSGKFSLLDTGYTPKLVVTTKSYKPYEDGLNNPEVLFVIDGQILEDEGHKVWQFKGKGEVKRNDSVCLYLYRQISGGFELVKVDDTDDFNFLHFLWQVYSELPETTQKEVHLVLDSNSFNEKFSKADFSHNLFFVYIECGGTPAADTPCRLDEMTTLGVTFDYGAIFSPVMGYTRELADTCRIPMSFIDFILRLDALKMSIETEHYVSAIGYWRWLMEDGGNSIAAFGTTKPCGCHG